MSHDHLLRAVENTKLTIGRKYKDRKVIDLLAEDASLLETWKKAKGATSEMQVLACYAKLRAAQQDLEKAVYHAHIVNPEPGVAPLRPAFLPEDQIKMAEEMCSPEFNPEPWAQWRERLNNWAGGLDTYQEIYDVARQIPQDTKPENVEPRRWWRSA